MSTPRTQSRDHEREASAEKRAAILAAALELFAERGFHGTAVPLVAEKAKVGAGTIYRYFDSKEALVNAVYQNEKRQMLDALLAEFPFDKPHREQFRVFFLRMAAYAKKQPLSVRFMELHHHQAYLDDASRHLEEHGNTMIEAAIHSGIQAEALKDLPVQTLIAVVWGVFLGVLRGWSEGRLELNDKTLIPIEQCLWEAIRR
ncbi:MAG: TetR/AcrR family transcriptional regulator [Deltaproteobacteria bacterium]|nr:TetR/AcrR family transcriptional regulator [Deltaproteobacteria bacterium]